MAENKKSYTIPIEYENENMKDGIKTALKSIFPIVGTNQELHLDDVSIDDIDVNPYDYAKQYDAKLRDKDYAAPYYGKLKLVDKATGKTVDSSKIKLGNLPLVTQRGSYIVGGNEYYTSLLVRRKPGIYAKIRENMEPAIEINSGKGRNMTMHIDDKGIVYIKRDKNIPLLPLLKSLGVEDATIKKQWGESVYTANMAKAHLQETSINKLHQDLFWDKKPASLEEGIEAIKKYLDTNTEFRPEVNKVTLGSPYTTLTPQAMVDASAKLIKLRKKEIDPDDIEHLAFKTLHSTSDLMRERIELLSSNIKKKLVRNVDKSDKVSSIVGSAPMDSYVMSLFNEFPNISMGDQSNPLSMVTNFNRTTVYGPGGINDSHAVTKENKNVSISHMGFFDVFHTPEKEAGLINNLTLGTVKSGNDIYKRTYDKNGKEALVSPKDLLEKSMAFADQVDVIDGKPVPKDPKSVKAIRGGKIVDIPWTDVDVIVPTQSYFFDHATNMVPFLNTDHGNRSYMAGKHMEQAVPIVSREAPLVQSNLVPAGLKTAVTMEKALGQDFSIWSPVSGTIESIDKKGMVINIKSDDGEKVKVPFYNNFHLSSNSILTSDILKNVGDRVKKDELIADTNFTKDGELAIGTNLNVAYMPYRGYNFEDGLVISDSAAKKMTSVHSYIEEYQPNDDDILSKKSFVAYAPMMFNSTQIDKLDDRGIIKEGQRIEPGDPLILILKKRTASPEVNMLARISKKFNTQFKPAPMEWDHSSPGEIIKVTEFGGNIKIIVKTEEALKVGDKLAARHGNKGVVSFIVPDDQMPKTVGGDKIDLIYSPITVPGRINLGQINEIAAGKIAKATGKPYMVTNFSDDNIAGKLNAELKRLGLKDKENVLDPTNGRIYRKVALGPEYIIKMHHMVDHKLSSHHPDKYDANMQPVKGGEEGAMAIDRLMLYAFLAHGARENMFEAAAYKSEKNDEFWRAFEQNQPLPKPKVPFVFNKLVDMIKGLGVNVNKDGSKYAMSPMTTKDIVKQSNGEITNAFGYVGKDISEIPGGIFDPKITGGFKGDKWSHISLAEPMPNPLFADAIKTITKLNDSQYEGFISGALYMDKDGTFNKDGKGITGGKVIAKLLDKIDLKERRDKLAAMAKESRGVNLNSVNKEIRYIDGLTKSGLKPSEAYILEAIPVVPPTVRPVYPDKSGKLVVNSLNYMYRFLLEGNAQLKEMNKKDLPDAVKENLRKDLYINTAALMGLKAPTVRVASRDFKGIIEIISGTNQPKSGFFQSKIFTKRQDLTGRSVIAMNNELHPDEIGIPVDMAWNLYRPFIMRKLIETGLSLTDARRKIDDKDKYAYEMMIKEMERRPVIVNRAPTLHKYGVMAMKPVPTHSKTIQLNPLDIIGFNADFDGDAMNVFVPVLESARLEAMSMFPSKHLVNSPKEGVSLLLSPQKEAAAGIWYASQVENKTNKQYASETDAINAYNKGEIDLTDSVKVKGKDITVGRIKLMQILPKGTEFESLDAKGLKKLMEKLVVKHPNEYATIANNLNIFGNAVAPEAGVSFGVSDMDMPGMFKERDKYIAQREKLIKDKNSIKELTHAYGAELREKMFDLQLNMPIESPFKRMAIAGMVKGQNIKGQSLTFLQMLNAPLLIEDLKKRVIPIPITKSYSEGLPLSQYLATSFGSRQGMADKAASTSEPGAMQKELMSANLADLITMADCGTTDGINLSIDDQDMVDRYLAEDTPGIGKRNDEVTPDMIAAARKKDKKELMVRSPMTCKAPHGTCQKCAGLDEKGNPIKMGTAFGVIATHALTEPVTQMAMKSFHQGGVYGAGTIANLFPRINQVVQVPKIYPDATTLAETSGKVTKLEKGMFGEYKLTIGDQEHVIPVGQKPTVGLGDKVDKGQALGEGLKNPRDVLRLLGVKQARIQMVNDLYNTYKLGGQSIRKRMFETVVKNITNTTRVIDPGTSHFAPGDYVKLSVIDDYNKKPMEEVKASESLGRELYDDLPGIQKSTKVTKDLLDKIDKMGYDKIKVKRTKVEHEPSLYGAAYVPLYFDEDWIARLGTTYLKDAIVEGASYGQTADVHGYHPVPAWAVGTEFGKDKNDPIKY